MKKKNTTTMRSDPKAYHQPRAAAVPAGRLLPNPHDQFAPAPLNSKLTPLHLPQEDPQTRPLHRKDLKLFPSARCYDLMPQECSLKDHSYTLLYLSRSSLEMQVVLVFLAGEATATYTSMPFKQLVQNFCDSEQRSSEPLILYPGHCRWGMCTLASNARRCLVHLMAWRCMLGGLIMGSGRSLANSAARPLDMKSV